MPAKYSDLPPKRMPLLPAPDKHAVISEYHNRPYVRDETLPANTLAAARLDPKATPIVPSAEELKDRVTTRHWYDASGQCVLSLPITGKVFDILAARWVQKETPEELVIRSSEIVNTNLIGGDYSHVTTGTIEEGPAPYSFFRYRIDRSIYSEIQISKNQQGLPIDVLYTTAGTDYCEPTYSFHYDYDEDGRLLRRTLHQYNPEIFQYNIVSVDLVITEGNNTCCAHYELINSNNPYELYFTHATTRIDANQRLMLSIGNNNSIGLRDSQRAQELLANSVKSIALHDTGAVGDVTVPSKLNSRTLVPPENQQILSDSEVRADLGLLTITDPDEYIPLKKLIEAARNYNKSPETPLETITRAVKEMKWNWWQNT